MACATILAEFASFFDQIRVVDAFFRLLEIQFVTVFFYDIVVVVVVAVVVVVVSSSSRSSSSSSNSSSSSSSSSIKRTYQGWNIWDNPIIEKSQDQDQGQGQGQDQISCGSAARCGSRWSWP